jgi:exonuclease V gamma subunit
MKVFVSNDLRALGDGLCQEVFSGGLPFEKKWIVIPSEEIKLALYLQALSHVEVVAGIKTITYRELMGKTFPQLPSKMELAFRLEMQLEPMEYLERGGIKRKLDFRDELSSLFLHYLERPRDEILQWLKKEGWQQRLWKRVFGDLIPTDQVHPLEGRFFFFHPTRMTDFEWKALCQMETSWFLFSPSEMFLGDFQTERQQQYLLANVKEEVREEFADSFEQDSPLLSNWGVCGRRLLQFFENEEMEELFQSQQEDSMLHCLQEEWRGLEKKESTKDYSIQLHSAPSLLREVEVVWELIQELPEGVLVLAPDIQSYQSAIEWVFAQRGGSYTIRGLEARTICATLQGFETLLTLPKYRFAVDRFEKLLLCPPFLKRFKLTPEEAQTLLGFLSDLHIRCDLSGWHEGLKRAVGQLATSHSFDFTDAPLLSRLIEMVLKIEKSFLMLPRTLGQWADFLQHLLETFFFVDEIPDVLNSVLLMLRNENIEGLFPFESIERAVQTAFSNRSGVSSKGALNGVHFSSLRPGTIVSAKTIILMGQQEGAPPKISSLAELPIINPAEEARALFLEAICSAEEKLILTYSRFHPEDGKPVKPSSLVEELIKDRKEITTIHHSFPISVQQKIPHAHEPLTSLKLNKIIEVSALKKLARHPIQFFFEQSLKVRFPFKKNHSEFLFSSLEIASLRKASLQSTTGQIIDELESQGKLPVGSFRSVACQTIEKELKEYHEALEKMNVDKESIFSLELTPYAEKLTQISKDQWVAPALKMEERWVQGTLEGVTPKGLLYHGEESVETLLKVWPMYCLAHVALGGASLFLSKKGQVAVPFIKDPHSALHRYLEYMEKSLKLPSPLLPAWGRRILKEGKIPESQEDEIVQWAHQRRLLPAAEEWMSSWGSYLSEVFCGI